MYKIMGDLNMYQLLWTGMLTSIVAVLVDLWWFREMRRKIWKLSTLQRITIRSRENTFKMYNFIANMANQFCMSFVPGVQGKT